MSELERKTAFLAEFVAALESILPILDDACFETNARATFQPHSAWSDLAASHAARRLKLRELLDRARS